MELFHKFILGSCGSGEYECSHDRCIDDSLTCNGWNPCGDWSDCPLAVGAIVGIVSGSICFVVVLSVAVCCGCRRRRRLVMLINTCFRFCLFNLITHFS